MRTWEDNAREFAALDQGEGWPFAVLVACSVEKGNRGGDTTSNFQSEIGKVTAQAFAIAAGTSPARVLRYLAAWDQAAVAGAVIAAADLAPDDVNKITVPDMAFKEFYKVPANAGGRTMGNIATAVDTIDKRGAEAVVAALTPEAKQAVVEAIIDQADPITIHIAQKAMQKAAPAVPQTDLSEQRREAEKRIEDEKKSRHSERYLSVDATLSRARALLSTARTDATDVVFSEWERNDLIETVARLIADAGLVRVVLAGESGADWDAGLAELNTEGR